MANGTDWRLNIVFEFTGARTPQRNHLAEVGFVTIWGWVRAMMVNANIPEDQQYLVYRKAISHASLLDGLMVITINGVTATRFVHLFGSNPRFINNMRVWGEAGVIEVTGAQKSKLQSQGAEGMFVGYSLNAPWDTFRM